MRILLVDNYDSYTFNVAHLFASVAGVAPEVVRNDAWDLDDVQRFDPDVVVISPGPGRPGTPRDLGLSARILAELDRPIFGICLGHQGLIWQLGGAIRRGAQPMHGRITPLLHDALGIFSGLPQGLPVVRYHSLVAQEPLPSDLHVSARDPQGAVMAVRELGRLRVGVQFHPESIGTPHGAQMVEAFLRLTGRARLHAVPAPAAARPPAPKGRPLRLAMRRLETPLDPEAAFLHAFAGRHGAFWLDSSGRQGANPSRFSLIGAGDGDLGHILRFHRGDGATTQRPGQPPEPLLGSIWDYLRLPRVRASSPPVPFSFRGGWVGYLGHESREDPPPPPASSGVPDLALVFCDRFAAIDHDTGQAWIGVVVPEDADPRPALYDLAHRLSDPPPPRPSTPPEPGALRPELPRSSYLDKIRRAQEALIEGESYEICLTQRLRGPRLRDPLSAYRRLRTANPAPFGAFLELEDLTILSSSPELFLSANATGLLTARPIKGTTARQADPSDDDRAAHALATSEKERAENLMIVDLIRHDLGRVCTWGSVEVPSLMAVERFATVHQLVSTIQGQLRPDADVWDALLAAFPPGSMTGAPKHRTLEILDHLEPSPRGPYGGALGWISFDGAAELAVVIRTAVLTEQATEVGVGGAITSLSCPEAEWREACLKGEVLQAALFRGEPDRSD
ncbi:MAG: aminodeoxychorismate synthase component I [Deltaproteobacteria bacterium]|nr:MAG: aminodeoxychorismate synthase component I [Deltaproteobacteria bacterium]